MLKSPRSPYERVGDLVYFARMLDKIRLHRAGLLRSDYHQNLGAGFDGRCARYLHVDYAKLVDRVNHGGSDEEILEWCFATGRRLNAEEVFVWNQFMTKRGLKDDASEELQDFKLAAGLSHRRDINTFFEFFEIDDGRKA